MSIATAHEDTGLQAAASASALVINGLIFAAMVWAGLTTEVAEENPEPPAIDVTLAELPRLGKEPEPNALPRITKPPAPPPPETDTASLSREIKEEQEEKKAEEEEKKQRELAEEKKRLEEEQRKKEELEERQRKRKEARERKRAMQDALRNLDDPRADEEDAPGLKEGVPEGTSTDPNSLYNKQVYASLVKTMLQRQFKVPANIPADERNRLRATLQFSIDEGGKVKGEPKMSRASGNKFFDDAALAAVRRFGPGSALKLPLPKDASLRKTVLHTGLTVTMDGKQAQ
ncbi:MAG: TonB C-terminal domain-containing protein [Myxococcales bacterium]|nr:TonB C-terminal domain-containing protein [Myxococcales bacterium]MCB9536877.1 TonB C-terminal domain-containing protein [Myxococcales bacterium]